MHNLRKTAMSSPSSSKLVGQPLLYAISCFASLGVFLVRIHVKIRVTNADRLLRSLDMTKGKEQPCRSLSVPESIS